MHHGNSRCVAGQGNSTSIHEVAAVAVRRKIRGGVTWFPVLPAIEGEDQLIIIRYVIATRDLEDFRFADLTGKAFLKALLPKRTKELLLEAELATCRTSLLRARPRLDLVCIWLDRRIMRSSRWVRCNNRSIHIQCDSSPIAERELFGMLMDIFFLGMTWVERCLNGSPSPKPRCNPPHRGHCAACFLRAASSSPP